MPQIELRPDSELSPTVQCYLGDTAEAVVRGIGGYHPEIAQRWFDLYLPLIREDGTVPLEIKELIRLQMAHFYGCGHCQSFIVPLARERGVTPEKVEHVLAPDDPAASFSEQERAALTFTLKMTEGKGDLSNKDFEQMRQHFSDAQIVEIGFLAALIFGYARFTITGFGLVG